MKKKIFLLMLLAGMQQSLFGAPLKVYLFVGQSNMKGSIGVADMNNYDPAIYPWVTSPDNPVLYHYWKDFQTNATWGALDSETTMGWEHVVAHRLYNYWQSVDTNINVAIFTVSKASTGLRSYWTAGGRDRAPWHYEPDPAYFPQGEGYQALTNRLQLALDQLDSMGYTNRDIEALFWYQGEGDSYNAAGGDNYRLLFEDLVHGWQDRDAGQFPNDDASAYGGSIREICGLTNLPAFPARINWQTKGSPAWGARNTWEFYLRQVRAALVDYTQSHPDCGWVDVDDIPLADYYHYSGENYCEVGERMAQKCIETLYQSDGPSLRILTPFNKGIIAPSATEISCEALALDANGAPLDEHALTWTSSEEGVFGSGVLSATLTNTFWETRVTSVGASIDTNSWRYTTNLVKRIQLKYTDPDGNVLVKNHWVKQEKRKLYVRCNASFWAPGGADDSKPYTLFEQVAQMGGHLRPVDIAAFNPWLNYSSPAFPGTAPAEADPSEYADYNEIVAGVSNTLSQSSYRGENLDFVLYSSHSTHTTDEIGGAGAEDEFVSNAIGWGKVGQVFNPESRLIIYEPWPYQFYVDDGTYVSLKAMGDDYHAVSQRAQSEISTNVAAGTARLVPNSLGWEARNWEQKLYLVEADGTVDKHAGDFGHVLATLMTYAQVYSNSASAIYPSAPDLYQPAFGSDWDLVSGSNGTNDIDDLMFVLSQDVRSLGETNELGQVVTMTTEDWQELARLADKLIFRPGDANLDGVVDDIDYNLVITNVDTVVSGSIWADGDFDADGDVDQDDLSILNSARGATLVVSAETVQVPEASTNGFMVKLGVAPESSVTVTVSRASGDTDLSVQSGSQLVFTTGNWDSWQSVILAAAADGDWQNGTAVFQISAPTYSASAESLTAIENDDDSNPNLQVPFSESFENDGSNAGTLGTLNGQREWSVSGSGAALVQNTEVYGGSQALSISNATVSHDFEGSPAEIWISYRSKPVFSDVPTELIASNASAAFYVNTNAKVVAYNGTTGTVLAASSVSNDWNFFEVHCDYSSRVWNLSVNGTQVLTNFAFYAAPSAFTGLDFMEESSGGPAYIDDLSITDSQGDDTDSDGLPDSWEQQYYGDTSVAPTNMAANGINTVQEAYIAGLNPTNPASMFMISDLSPQTSVLQWTAAFGRVYSVFWTSNLLSGFPVQPLASNITTGVFTDAVHGAEQDGFYKIEVEME